MLLTIVLLLAITSAEAIKITACNCSQPTLIGAIHFDDLTNCNHGVAPIPPVQVNYAVFTNKRGRRTFPGTICSKWKEIHLYVTFALGGWNVDKKKEEFTVSPSECRYMRSTLNCLDNQMTPVPDDENTWSHDKRPEGGPVWPWNSNYTMTNCMVKDVMMEQECENCPIISPLGSLGNKTKTKSAVYNHLTIVWDDFLNRESNCELKVIAEGTGLLYNKKGEHPARLRDHTRQLDFLLDNPEASPCPSTMKFNASRLKGSTNIFVFYGLPQNSTGKSDNKDAIPELLSAHLQYEDDSMIERLNVLANEINLLDCEIRKNKRDQIIATARQDNLLAARQLGLQVCQTVQANELTAIVHQCQKLEAEFIVEVTRCGPQPRFGNYSIAYDGWRLVPFLACRYTTGLVPLNGDLYRNENNTWIPIEANMKLSHQSFIDNFDIEADEALRFIPQGQATHDLMYTDQVNVIADLTSTMRENNVESFSQMSFENLFSNPLETIKRKAWEAAIMVGIFIFVVLIICACIRSNCCCRLCYCLCVTCCPKPATNNDEMQMTPLRPRNNRAIEYHIEDP